MTRALELAEECDRNSAAIMSQLDAGEKVNQSDVAALLALMLRAQAELLRRVAGL